MRPFRPSVVAVTLFALLVAGPAAVAVADAREDDAPKKVEVALVLLTEANIASLAIDVEPLVAWLKPVMGELETHFAAESRRRTAVIQVTLHPDRPGEVVVAGRPALSQGEAEALLKLADLSKAPRTRVVECSFRIVAKVNGGDPDASGPLEPPILTPYDQRIARFRAASTAEKLSLMKTWARTEAIPVLAAAALQADPKFLGVHALGKALAGVKPTGPIDELALTDKNGDYWRALMEMAPGNPLVPAVRVALHVANGKIDQARRCARAIAPFDKNDSGASRLLGEFGQMSTLFYEAIEARIRDGITHNDEGKLDEALSDFDGVLKDYPMSAWAHYERFHTGREKKLRAEEPVAKLHEGWPEVRRAILEADPLYSSMAEATGPDELYDLLLRKETENLFKERDKFGRDFVRYADIAVDLDQPGFAALLYWEALTALKAEDYGRRDLIEDVLFCLEQLGIKDMKGNFKGDHAAEFKRIEAERARRKRESPAFRSPSEPLLSDPVKPTSDR